MSNKRPIVDLTQKPDLCSINEFAGQVLSGPNALTRAVLRDEYGDSLNRILTDLPKAEENESDRPEMPR